MAKLQIGVNDLATVRPDLISEWDFNKNVGISPDTVSKGSNIKVWWVCHNCGYNWLTSVKLRTDGHNCPACGKHNKERLQRKKVWATCGVDDLATVNPDLASEWNYNRNKNFTPFTITGGSHRKVWWICSKCGFEYEATVINRKNGSGCPNCVRKYRSIRQATAGLDTNNLALLYPDIAREWRIKNNISPYQVKPNSRRKAIWVCNLGHEYEAQVLSRTNGGTGCPYCSNNKVLTGYNDLATIRPDLVSEWHPFKNGDLTPFNITVRSGKLVWWKCKYGHEWQVSPHDRVKSSCPYCNGSKTEHLLYEILQDLSITFIKEKRFTGTYIRDYRYDVYIPTYRCIIEADGMQHFFDLSFFEDTPFTTRVLKDKKKNKFCLDNHIALLRIPYVYNPDKDKDKIKDIVLHFLKDKVIPIDIIQFYAEHGFEDYANIAKSYDKVEQTFPRYKNIC